MDTPLRPSVSPQQQGEQQNNSRTRYVRGGPGSGASNRLSPRKSEKTGWVGRAGGGVGEGEEREGERRGGGESHISGLVNNNNRIQRRYSRFFCNLLTAPRTSGPGAIVCKSRATHRALVTCKCHVTCHLVRRDSSTIKFDRVEIAFI